MHRRTAVGFIVAALAGNALAATWEGKVDGQLDNEANWQSGTLSDKNLNFAKSYGQPLYLNADMCANGFKYSSNGGTISNEFALGAGKTLWITNNSDNACHLKGNDTFLTLSSGTLKLGDGSTSATVACVGNGAAEGLAMLVTGKDTALDLGSAGKFSLGWGCARSLLAIRDGASFFGEIGVGIPNAASSGNTLLVADPGTTFTAPSYVYIGNQGSGNAVIVSNGASFVANAIKFTPANYGDPTGVGNVFRVEAGATVQVTGGVGLYYSSSNRVEVLNGGQLDVSGGLDVGYDYVNTRYASGNEVIVDGEGSALNIKSGGLVLAQRVNNNLGGMQYARIRNGGAMTVAGESDNTRIGYLSPATLEVTDGGTFVTSNKYVWVGYDSVVGGSKIVVGKDARFVAASTDANAAINIRGQEGNPSQIIVDSGTLTANQICPSRYVETIVKGRNGRLTAGDKLLMKGCTTLEITVSAEGFAATPVAMKNAMTFEAVDGEGAPTVKIDASAFTGSARLVLVESANADMTGVENVTFEVSENAKLDLSNPRQIAVYVNVDVLCTGEGTSDWYDDNNWTNIATGGAKACPKAGDGVIVAPSVAKTFILNATTPKYKALEIGGNVAVTLVATNWTTAISADSVTIRNGSTVTCAGPFRDTEMSNRVWIVCKDFTLDAGGKIDVDNKGYAHGDKGATGNAWAGYGPGGGFRSGATHGGYGGQCAVLYADGHVLALPNDDAAEPVLPGSGGARGNWSDKDNHGGGAVRIDATGTVSLNGSILASAAGGFWDGTYTGFGAGGSILIHAATLQGAGVLKAEGGSTAAVPPIKTNAGSPFPGGGGRIALHYTAASAANLTVSVREGLFNNGNYPAGSNDYNRAEADMGTLYFSDDSIWTNGLGKRITGMIANPHATAYDFGDVGFTAGHVRFGADGLTFRMKSLSVSGNNVRFELGGSTVEQTAGFRECRSTTPNALVVAGDLLVADNGRLDVRAAANGDDDGVGATVTVGGNMTVGDKGYVYAWSDVLTGARPQFVVSNDVTVAVGGVVSAERRGYAGGHDATTDPVRQTFGHGAGAGRFFDYGGIYLQYAGGGGHGGKGSISSSVAAVDAATSGLTYDNEKYPTLPGSGGAHYNSCMWGGAAGGGVIEIIAGGTMTVNGLVNADGEVAHGQRMGAGAGGSVTLFAPTFAGAGSLSAQGGSVSPSETSIEQMFRTGAGGGGRIAVVLGNRFEDTTDKVMRRIDLPETFTGEADVRGGTHPYDTYEQRLEGQGVLQGAAGSVRYSRLEEKTGLIFLMR